MSLVDVATSTATASAGRAIDDSILDRKFAAFTGNIVMVGCGSIGQGVIPYVPWSHRGGGRPNHITKHHFLFLFLPC
jgi:hypothetical protein